MTRESYKNKSGEVCFRPVLDSESEAEGGWCLACGVEDPSVEPDARRYKCEGCGEHKVFGIEELFLMGIARFSEDKKVNLPFG